MSSLNTIEPENPDTFVWHKAMLFNQTILVTRATLIDKPHIQAPEGMHLTHVQHRYCWPKMPGSINKDVDTCYWGTIISHAPLASNVNLSDEDVNTLIAAVVNDDNICSPEEFLQNIEQIVSEEVEQAVSNYIDSCDRLVEALQKLPNWKEDCTCDCDNIEHLHICLGDKDLADDICLLCGGRMG
jgi:hypothetical protein